MSGLYFLFLVLPLFASVFIILPLVVFLKLKETELKQQRQNDLLELNLFLLRTLRQSRRHVYGGDDDDDSNDDARGAHKGSGFEGIVEEEAMKKKKKKRGKKKKEEEEDEDVDLSEVKGEGADVVCLYPFTSSTSATQRKIKKQYDELFKCNASNKLTLSQVGQFVTCLVKARHELQHKADAIQRKFTITKALLNKADRSSLERLRKQICKLEFEQKRLEEDASVYNWLQHQLKLSPAYKKMLEIACTELKNISREQMESKDEEFTEISFEDFLAQEKKDSFWQKNMKSRSCTS